ncbi:MAG: ferritin-like domain-containing protein [Streptosporangiaceae bacterium]
MTEVEKNRIEELDPLWLLNQYRVAELRGAGAIMRMGRLADDLTLTTDLSRHLRDESVHAWLWTKVIRDMGGQLVEMDEPYQTRLALNFGIPRSLTDLLALTWVSERRGVKQYKEHLDVAEASPLIKRTLRGILKDEQWHVEYISKELQRRVHADARVQQTIDKALEADLTSVDALRAMPELDKVAAHDAGQPL